MEKCGKKIKSGFGFRLHLVVDAEVELPVAYEVTPASTGEQPVMRKMLVKLQESHPALIKSYRNGMLDKGYESEENITQLWDKYKIKPILDIRNMWKEGEKTQGLKTKKVQGVTYDYRGTVFCHCPKTGEIRPMAYGGFEKTTETLKYLCPALH